MEWKTLLIPLLLVSVVKGDFYWYKNAVVYQIYVRSFQDSNNDGIGDLRGKFTVISYRTIFGIISTNLIYRMFSGIIQHASYLESLGIEAVWLSPIYPSPNADFGYDISDMLHINPEYGTMEDFNELLQELKSRGNSIY